MPPLHCTFVNLFYKMNNNINVISKINPTPYRVYTYKNKAFQWYKPYYSLEKNDPRLIDYIVTNKTDCYFKYRNDYKIRYIPFFKLCSIDSSRGIQTEIENSIIFSISGGNLDYSCDDFDKLLTDKDIDIIEKHFKCVYTDFLNLSPLISTEDIIKREDLLNHRIFRRSNDFDTKTKQYLHYYVGNSYLIHTNLDPEKYLMYFMDNPIYDPNKSVKLVWFKSNIETDKYLNSLRKMLKAENSELHYISEDGLYIWEFFYSKYFDIEYTYQKICNKLLNSLEKDFFINCTSEDDMFKILDELSQNVN